MQTWNRQMQTTQIVIKEHCQKFYIKQKSAHGLNKNMADAVIEIAL